MIQCNEISQTINYLSNAFDNCHKINPSDLFMLVELVAAIYNCSEQGTQYNTLVENIYEPITDTEINYPELNYHSINVMVLQGKISKLIEGSIVEFPTGTVLRHEVTTLNNEPYTFIAKAGSKVVVERLTETI